MKDEIKTEIRNKMKFTKEEMNTRHDEIKQEMGCIKEKMQDEKHKNEIKRRI